MKSKLNLLFGLIIVVIGILFLGNSLNLWNVNIFFNGWWSLFIIVPAVYGLLRGKGFYANILVLAVGVLLLLAAQNVINWIMVSKLFIPILLIVIGISLIFKPNFKKLIKNIEGEYIGLFSGTSEKIVGKFRGTACTAIFGGVELDLTETEIEEDIVIKCICIFGGIDIKVPHNITVKTTGIPIFGGLDNSVRSEEKAKTKTINIDYICVFGGIDIK